MPDHVEVINPDLYLLSGDSPDTELDIELFVEILTKTSKFTKKQKTLRTLKVNESKTCNKKIEIFCFFRKF